MTLQEAYRPASTALDARAALLTTIGGTERRLELEGVSTAVLEAGDGPPVILLHGPGANVTHWMRVIPELSLTHRVIAADLPGHGGSRLPQGPLDQKRVLGWLARLVEQTCPSAPALVGQLLGGAIAMRAAIADASAFSRLVLIDTFALCDFAPAPEFGAALQAFGMAPAEDTHRALWAQCAHDFEALRRDMGALFGPFETYNIDRARSPEQQAALEQLMLAFGVHQIPATELDRIALPTTLIWGRHDRATPLAVARAASTRHGWPLYIVDGANDDPPVERPELVCQVLGVALNERVELLAAPRAP